MNFIDRFMLLLVMAPAGLYRKAGIDTAQLRAILTAKLTMDNRRPAAFGNFRKNAEKKTVSKATLGTLFGSLFMGLMMLYCFALGVDMVTKLTMYMTMFIFMLCITLITDFTSVLIDVRDNLILLPKPISDKTFMLARLLHITVRTSIVVLPMTLPACVTSAVMQNAAYILPFLFLTLLATVFSIFLINAIYLLILRLTTPAKFQNVIGTIQIAFVMIIMLGYQIMPRLVQSSTLEGVSVESHPVVRFFPAYWFADACVTMTGQGSGAHGWWSILLSIVVPLLSMVLVVKVFAPSFNQKLGMITGGSAESNTKVKRAKRFDWTDRLARWFTRPGAERAGFVFASRMMGRSRDFKMKVYPSIGYIIVMSGVFLYQNPSWRDVERMDGKLTPILLFITYLSSMVLSGALMQLQYSDKFKAGWMFRIAPVSRPGAIISGAVKSILVHFFLPLSIVLAVLGLVLQGPVVLPSLLLGCVNVVSIACITAVLTLHSLPFSKALEGSAAGNTFIRTMLLLVVPALFGLIHWAVSGMLWVVLLLLVVSLLVPWLVLDDLSKKEWRELKD